MIGHNVRYVSTQYRHTNVIQWQLTNGSVLIKVQLILSDYNETKQIIAISINAVCPPVSDSSNLGDYALALFLTSNQINNTNMQSIAILKL